MPPKKPATKASTSKKTVKPAKPKASSVPKAANAPAKGGKAPAKLVATSVKKSTPKAKGVKVKTTAAKSTKVIAKATATKAVDGKKATKAANSKAPAKKVIHQSIFNDRAVELRGYLPLNAYTVVQIQQALVLQRLAKDGDGDTTSSIKLILGPSSANKYRHQDQAALADSMVLIRGSVDTVIRSALDVDSLKAFLSATGKRYMTAGAELYMGVVSHSSPYDKNRGQQVRRKLFNDYVRDLMLRVHEVSGESNLQKIYQDLVSARGLSALEALAYGTHGLIDGVLMDETNVITRAQLDDHLNTKKLKGEALKQYLRQYMSVYDVATVPLQKTYPASLAAGTTSLYQSLVSPEKPKEVAKKGKKASAAPAKPLFYRGEKPMETFPLMVRPHKDKPYRRLMIRPMPSQAYSFLEEDTIFFQDGFTDETAQQMGDALRAMDHKKLERGDKTPIKLVINSPGGSVWSGQELRSLIRSLGSKVDVITVGMAASCGSWLLSSATGSRLATPQARIMIHEAATQLSDRAPHNHYNEMHDDLDQSTQNYVAIVADATGRPFPEVLKDFDLDVWFNPLEALFYGPKGLIDGIIVGPAHVMNRAQVEAALIKELGSKAKLDAYVAAQLAKKRDPRQMMAWRPEEHDLNDPFTNPLRWIHQHSRNVAKYTVETTLGKGVLTSVTKVKAAKGQTTSTKAAPAAGRSVDYTTVVLEKP